MPRVFPVFSRLLDRIFPADSKEKATLPFILAQNPYVSIFRLKAGKYKIVAGARRGIVRLHRDFRLMPVTKGLLKQFAGNEMADGILEKAENAERMDAAPIVCINMFEAADVPQVMNQRFGRDGIRVSVPTEAVIDVFISLWRHRTEIKGLENILTSSLMQESVDTETLERVLLSRQIDKDDIFVARNAQHPKYRIKKYANNGSHVNNLLLEVAVHTHDPRDPTLA